MHPHRVRQEQIPRACRQNGRRKPVHVAIYRRQQRILQVVPIGIQQRRRVQEPIVRHQHVVDHLVGIETVAGLGHIRPWRAGCDRARQRQVLHLCAQHHRQCHAATGGCAEYSDILWLRRLQHRAVHQHRIIHRGGIGIIRRHPVIHRNHLEPTEPGKLDRFLGRRLTRAQHIGATVHVHQHAVAIARRDHLRRHDERLHAIDRCRLHRHAQLVADLRQCCDHCRRGLAHDRLPLVRRLRHYVPCGIVRLRDDRLHLRADGIRHGKHLRRHLARSRRYGLRKHGVPITIRASAAVCVSLIVVPPLLTVSFGARQDRLD